MIDKTTGEAIGMLFRSRKFLLLLMDTVISLIFYFVAKYAGPALEDVKYVILALQVPVATVIYAIARDNDTEAKLQESRIAADTQRAVAGQAAGGKSALP